MKSDDTSILQAGALLSPVKVKRPKLYLWSTKEPLSYIATPVPSNDGLTLPSDDILLITANDLASDFGSDDPEKPEGRSSGGGNEMTKLKGVIWPGMDIFDSATPYMRRKRNQKKESSVLERLEQDSQQVDPTEKIYTNSCELRKQRKITGRVDLSSSPEMESRPPLTKSRSLKRVPLEDKDVNVSTKRRTGTTLSQAANVARPHTRRPSGVVSPSVKQAKKRKKSTTQVFRDESKPFGNPTGMPVLTSEFHYSPQVLDTHQDDGPITQYGPALQPSSAFFDPVYGGYHACYYPAGHGVFSLPAYDLSALLAHVASFAPSRQSTANEPDNAEVEHHSGSPVFSEELSEAQDS